MNLSVEEIIVVMDCLAGRISYLVEVGDYSLLKLTVDVLQKFDTLKRSKLNES